MAGAAGFEAFYRENLARIVKACALVTLDPHLGEEIAAEAFARLWSRWGAIRSEDHAGGFVYKTAMRLCARELRQRSPRKEEDTHGPDEIERTLLRRDLGRVLAQLSPRQRQIVVLRDWAGYPTRDVARVLRIREATARVHLARARERLREALLMEEERG